MPGIEARRRVLAALAQKDFEAKLIGNELSLLAGSPLAGASRGDVLF